MSSPSSAGGNSVAIREGTRVILREITANLQNSPPAQSPRRKSGNEATPIKGEQHDVKVRFIREFADAGASGREANTESSLSSASSFQSLTSTLSSKCSSGICVDSSPAKASDTSYINADISGLDDLISACENIRLNDNTLDLSKDQSFSLQLDGEDLSDDQTFTSAVDRNSPNRTADFSVANTPVKFQPDATQLLDSTRNVDKETDKSVANGYFECATVDSVEASRYHQANSELDSVNETFVQCVSNLAQFEPAARGNPRDNLDAVELAKTEGTHENLEIHGNDNIDSVGNTTTSLDDFPGNSTATLESLSDLIVDDPAVESKENGEIARSDVAEKSAQSLLNVTVDFPSDLQEIENVAAKQNEPAEKSTHSFLDVTVDLKDIENVETKQNQVAEQSARSLLDVTVDFPSDLKDIENVATKQNEVADKSARSLLDVTVDFPSDLKDIENVATKQNEVADKSARSLLDVTVDFPSDLKEIQQVVTNQNEAAEKSTPSFLEVTVDLKEIEKVATEQNEVAEKSAQPSLNVTVDFPRDSEEIENVATKQIEVAEESTQSLLNVTVDFKEIDAIETSNFEEKVTGSQSDLVVDDISNTESFDRCKPSTTAPSLPSLSSVCLQSTLPESDGFLEEQSVENVRSIEDSVPTVSAPSLSEKFANIAADANTQGNSISTIQEPTFLNAQKLVEDSIEFREEEPVAKTENASLSNNNENIVNSTPEIPRNLEIPSQIDFCEFKKPEPPAERAASKVVSPIKAEKNKIICKAETEKQVIQDNVARSRDSSANSEDLDDTVTIQDISAGNIFAAAESDQYAEFLPQQQSTGLTLERAPTVDLKKSGLVAGAGLISGDNSVSKPISLPDEYAAFLPQQQSTTLTEFADRPLGKLERQQTPFVTACPPHVGAIFNGENNKCFVPTSTVDDRCNFEKLELAAKAVANDIQNTSLELEENNSDSFVSATSELFHDPGSFDFLLSKTPRKNTRRDLRTESLYVKFDPLVSNTSMLPQGNIQNASPPVNEARNGDNNTTITTIGTPKRTPAIEAIDRLLFYSPMTTTTTPTPNTANIKKTNDSQEKVEPTEETSAETVNMAKELELVRSTVIQLEEQLEKLKVDHEEALEKQSSYQEKINQLQTQLAQEIKNKNQITVVVDEYEKSISRLVAERERDRKNLDLEKAKLQEELAAAKHHLDNTEAAFNDVHLKYERLKAVVTTYKSNEVALRQSIQENVEIIKSLENRYEQVKEHATARLEKANQDLDAIRKQNESETVRLHAMLRKTELKSNSLAELVEQKTKENKELTQILDEVIARVGRNNSE